jgi:type II secretory pathway component GspD/PulD (secretin)/tetratricopeptide (TPR) repeat protein
LKLWHVVIAVTVVGMLLAVGAASSVAANGQNATTAPAAVSAQQLVEEAKTLYAAHNYEAALKRLQSVKTDELNFFEKTFTFNPLLEKTQKAVPAKAADEKALAEGNEAFGKEQYAAAIAKLSLAAESDYLTTEQTTQAKAVLLKAKDKAAAKPAEKTVAVAAAKTAEKAPAAKTAAVVAKPAEKAVVKPAAKDQVAEAKTLYDAGKYEDSLKLLKSVNTDDLNFFEKTFTYNPLVSKAEKAVAEAQAAKVAAAKPVEKPVAAKPVEAPVAVVAAPVAAPTAAPAASLMDQVKRAEAEDELKLGADAMSRSEFAKAKVHYEKALSLWPDNAKAQKGLKDAEQFTGERQEPLSDILRQQQALERQHIIAEIQELLADSEKQAAKAARPEDYGDALRPLAQADRMIDQANVLTLEEKERMREDVLSLRTQISNSQKTAQDSRLEIARREALKVETVRRQQDQQERDKKLAQLWQRTTELRKSMQFNEAIQILEKIIAIDPNDERAQRWKDDLLFLEAQERQVKVRGTREGSAVEALVDVEEATIQPGEKVNGEDKFLRYPSAKKWKELTELRRELIKAVQAEPKGVSETRKKLGDEIDLDFERTSLDNVLKYISELQKVNIVISPDIGVEGIDLSSRLVDLKVKRVSIEAVFGLILGADLGYKVESGYVLVTTRTKLQQNLPIVIYPVQDLIAVIPDYGIFVPRFQLSNIGNNAGGGTGGGMGGLFAATPAQPAADTANMGSAELITIIKQTINATSDPMVAQWSDEGGPAVIQFLNGTLIVSQTRKGQQRIAELLEQLRRERAIMVSVEGRFCTVTDDFLNEITLDVDAAFFNRNEPTIASGFGNGTTSGLAGGPPAPVTLPGAAGISGLGAAYPTLPGAGVAPQVNQPIVLQQTGSNGEGLTKLLPLAGSAFSAFTANEGGMVLSGVFLDDIQVGFLLRAIQADARSQSTSAPRITLYNGQHSYLSVGTMVTYVADATPIVGEFAVGWDLTIGAVPVGMTLDVKATVSADRRYVQMDLRPQVVDTNIADWRQVTVSASGGAFTVIDLPVVEVEDFSTTVSVPDGGTLLLAGAKKFSEVDAETGVPFLSKIPIIKRLFNNRGTIRTNSNLLILVRPKIIIQAEEEHLLGYDNF